MKAVIQPLLFVTTMAMSTWILEKNGEQLFITVEKSEVETYVGGLEILDDDMVDLLDGKTVWGPDGSRYTLEESA